MIEEDWDDIYKKYSLNQIPWHSNQPDRNLVRMIKKKQLKKGTVLDLCSGDGTNSIYLASKGFKVVGVDISPTAIKIAKERCVKRNVLCDYVTGDVMKIKLDKKFDLILDRGCFHHISRQNKPTYVQRVHQSLKKRGKFYLLCFSDKNPPFEKNLSREDIKRHFSDGFNILFIKNSVHIEPSSGQKRHLYAVFMEKKN
jgi:cyclopropane fatty-acyl-phospholipid synthase-like methyltransferase